MRYFTDCRETPSVMNCSVAIFADSRDEVTEAAVQHMVDVHDHQDTPEIRKEVQANIHQTEEDVPAR